MYKYYILDITIKLKVNQAQDDELLYLQYAFINISNYT